jgi:hypothetical protein
LDEVVEPIAAGLQPLPEEVGLSLVASLLCNGCHAFNYQINIKQQQ